MKPWRAMLWRWPRKRACGCISTFPSPAKEVEECRGRHGGMSPVAYFEAIGLFEVPTTAAHCVWVDEADMDILALSAGVFVANNPASNLKLGSGFAPDSAHVREGRECVPGL